MSFWHAVEVAFFIRRKDAFPEEAITKIFFLIWFNIRNRLNEYLLRTCKRCEKFHCRPLASIATGNDTDWNVKTRFEIPPPPSAAALDAVGYWGKQQFLFGNGLSIPERPKVRTIE